MLGLALWNEKSNGILYDQLIIVQSIIDHVLRKLLCCSRCEITTYSQLFLEIIGV